MAQGTITTKRERRQAAKRDKLEAQRRARRKRALWTWGIPLGIVAVIAVAAILGTRGGRDVPATSAAVEIAGPARTTLIQGGQAVPSFSASGLDGSEVGWAPGAPSLVSIWAPWCPVCQVEVPMIDRVARDFPDLKVISVATAVDARPGPSVSEFVTEGRLTIPVALDDEAGTLARAMGIAGFPTTYLVEADGTVGAVFEGEMGEQKLRLAIRDLISDGPS